MNPSRLRLLALSLFASAPVFAAAPPVISNGFDNDVEGWTEVDYPTSQSETMPETRPATFDASQGNPVGSLRVMDNYPETGVAAPAKYLGNLGAYYGGTFEYDIQVRTNDEFAYGEVVLRSDGLSLFFVPATFPTTNVLEHRTVPLTEDGWFVGGTGGDPATAAQMQQVLSALTGFYVRTEWFTGPDDTTFDNPRLSNAGGNTANTVSFEKAQVLIGEGGNKATIGVVRTGVLSGPATVSYATADHGATAGADYVATSGTLHWASGEGGIKTFKVPVIEDSIDEINELVDLKLSAPAGTRLGTQSTALLKIRDNDPAVAVSFVSASDEVVEGTGKARKLKLTVQLDAVSGRNVKVPYSVTFGSASSDDIEPVVGSPLTIRAGQTTATIEIATVPDSVKESNETLTVTLGTPINATLGATTAETVTIRNDDH